MPSVVVCIKEVVMSYDIVELSAVILYGMNMSWAEHWSTGADGRGTAFRTFGDTYCPTVIQVMSAIPVNVPTKAPYRKIQYCTMCIQINRSLMIVFFSDKAILMNTIIHVLNIQMLITWRKATTNQRISQY
jgi:hypothetical protein